MSIMIYMLTRISFSVNNVWYNYLAVHEANLADFEYILPEIWIAAGKVIFLICV